MNPFLARPPMLRSLLALPIFIVLIDQAIVSGVRLVPQVILARWAPDNAYGLGFYVSTFGFVVLFLTYLESFVTTPVNVFLPGKKDAQRRIFFADALRAALLVIAISALVCLAGSLAFSAAGSENRYFSVTLFWYLPLHMLREFARRWFLVTGRLRLLVGLDLAAGVLLISLLTGWISMRPITAISMLGLVSLCNLMFVAVWWWRSRREFDFHARSEESFARIGWDYGRWVAGEGTFSALIMYFTQWYVATTMSKSSGDLYGACLTLVFLANPFLLGVTSYFAPRGAAIFHIEGWSGYRKFMVRYTVFVVVVLGLIALLIFQFGPQVFSLLFSAKYASASTAAAILSVGMIFQGVAFLMAMTLQTIRAPQVNTIASMIGAVLVVVYCFAFIRDRIDVAAFGFLLSTFFAASIRIVGIWFVLSRRYEPA